MFLCIKFILCQNAYYQSQYNQLNTDEQICMLHISCLGCFSIITFTMCKPSLPPFFCIEASVGPQPSDDQCPLLLSQNPGHWGGLAPALVSYATSFPGFSYVIELSGFQRHPLIPTQSIYIDSQCICFFKDFLFHLLFRFLTKYISQIYLP